MNPPTDNPGTPPEGLHDIPDPQPWLPGIEIPVWAWAGAGVLVLALAGLALWLLVFRTSSAPRPDPSNYEDCRRELEALRGQAARQSLAVTATNASLVVRRYLAVTLDEPALYETHEETLARGDALAALPAGARERLAPLLEDLAACKYGPSRDDPAAAEALVEQSLEVLGGLESTRPRRVA